MFSHTLFSLPFGLAAMFWAAGGLPPARTLIWTVVALVGARNGANALNRIIDRRIDAKNPRTAGRHLPKGAVKLKEAVAIACVCFIMLVVAAFMLNPVCVVLLPFAFFLFFIYSFTKRFTWACHIMLGLACGGAPVGAWIAVTGWIGWPSLILGTAVTLWVAGFDIIYAIQDIDFDRDEDLHSIPAAFGIKTALAVSASFHAGAVLLLLYLYFLMHMNWVYLAGLLLVTALLVAEHSIVSPSRLKNIIAASYGMNRVVSSVFLIFTSVSIFMG
jgi:4-hydroxybenzoate polyprenyltransferase